MSEHDAKHMAEAAMGAVQQLAQNGGMNLGHPHGIARFGGMLVTGAAAVAPGAMAHASAATVATLVAGAGAAATAAPFVALAAVGYGVYWLTKRLSD